MELEDQFSSQSYFGKSAKVSASLLPQPGVYGFFFEITDPDGHFVELGIDEVIGTINVH